MVQSAFFGQAPATDEDYAILLGFAKVAGLPAKMISRTHGFPIPVKPSEYANPYANHSGNVIGSLSVVVFLILLITGMRLWLRIFRRDLRVGLDDFFIAIGAVGVCSWCLLALAQGVIGGSGKHLYDVTYVELYWFFRLAAIASVVFWPSMGFVAISITLFNRRLTGLTSSRWQYAHYTFLFILSGFIISSILANVLNCRPYTINFSLIDYGLYDGPIQCFSEDNLGISFSAIHTATQFCLLAVPLIIVYMINMSTLKKLRLAFLFSIGSIACIGAVMRQVTQKRQSQADTTWTFISQLSWTIVDLFFTTIAASLPVLNAAVPLRWRSPSPSSPQLGNLSILRRSGPHKDSVKMVSQEFQIRPDGTVSDEPLEEDPEHGLVEKDSFTRRTEERWEEAFETSKKTEKVGVVA